MDPELMRQRLLSFLEALPIDPRVGLRDDTSLIRSGLLDSLNLVELVEWIEEQVGSPVDLLATDLVTEWDTIADILGFLTRHVTA